jgi:aromatase
MNRSFRQVEHSIEVTAPADAVYRLIAQVENWPILFPPTVHVEYAERGDHDERIRIWATANGEAKTWFSRRTLDQDARRITFRQEVSAPPVAAMGGTWIIDPVSAGACLVRLLHDYRAIDDDPSKLAWIDQAVERNSKSELAALKAGAEMTAGSRSGLLLSFEDTVRINGLAEDVYDFLNRAELWRERLPHVSRVSLLEEEPGLQVLEMDTSTKDGSTHTTKSVRVCFPSRRIFYKQTVLPALLSLHTGAWTLVPDGDGVLAASRHTVVINAQNITRVLGDRAGIDDAKDFVRNALSGNSTATLQHAKAYAEGRRESRPEPAARS